ncbi:MAG: hypothetical protein WBQ17_00865 [Rhizomicrobium sp.]
MLADACIKAGGGTADASLSSRCECAASAAEKYLDPEDYKLLVGVAGIYNENISAGTKLQELIVGIANEGVTPSKASVAAMDMMFLAHKVANECAASGHQNV